MAKMGVLLPAYNAEDTLNEALFSLARQTLRDIDVLVVDDGSTDSTPQIVEAWTHKDRRFHGLSRPHRGIVPALNDGLRALQTPLVARMDADDIAHEDRLEKQLSRMEADRDLTLCATQYEILSDQPVAPGSTTYRDWQNGLLTDDEIRLNLWVESPFAHPTVCFYREAVLSLGGYTDTDWPEDYDLWLRMANAGARFAKVAEPLVGWRDRPDRLTWTDARYSIDAFFRCKAHHLARGPLRGRGPVIIAGAGITGGRVGRALMNEGVEITAYLDVDPRKIGGSKRGRPVVGWETGLNQYRSQFLLAAVGSRGGRQTVRALLNEQGYQEGQDYLCVA